MLVGIGAFKMLHEKLSFLQLITVKIAITIAGTLTLINWIDLTAAVAWQAMAFGVLCIGAAEMMALPVHQTIMSLVLPATLQMKYNGILNIFSTFGRGASPFIASLIMGSLEASRPKGEHLSSNVLFAFQVTLCLTATLIPLLGYRTEYYGEWLKEASKDDML
mmetsp:Transcript_5610/g.11733  ORF Transcript_5610/g.11733 Transcript_5610/m.11733 type:complete len:163 (-) Transcript_5610:441-929(-)